MRCHEVAILAELNRAGASAPMSAMTIGAITAALQETSSKALSYSTIHNSLASLITAELTNYGVKQAQAQTYYLTERGLLKLAELVGRGI